MTNFRIDVMVDIETLGTSADSFIFQIAAIAFDIATGKEIETFNRTVDISTEDWMRVDGSTLLWWLNTDKELLTNLLNSGVGTSTDVITDFHRWLEKLDDTYPGELYLWGNGILFDNNMIKTHFEEIGLTTPVNFRNDRDVRTLAELAAIKLNTTVSDIRKKFERGTAHDAFDDVRHQIAYSVFCFQTLTQDPKPEGKKWYLYRNPETNSERKFEEEHPELEKEGFVLVEVVDTYVDEKAVKVGGGV